MHKNNIQRYGWVIGIKKEKLQEYKELHANVWPKVLAMIKDCNIANYSIYLGQLDDDNYYLFSYLEYIGNDFKKDMEKMAADEISQKWWAVCKPCQLPCKHRKDGEWWMTMDEVFHIE